MVYFSGWDNFKRHEPPIDAHELFNKEWNELAENGKNDYEIDSILENKLIELGVIKIGELDDFYIVLTKLGEREKEIIQGFIKSILKVRKDITNRTMIIRQTFMEKRGINSKIISLLDNTEIERIQNIPKKLYMKILAESN